MPKLASLRPRSARFTNVRRDPTRFKTRWGLVGVPLDSLGFGQARGGSLSFAEGSLKLSLRLSFAKVHQGSSGVL